MYSHCCGAPSVMIVIQVCHSCLANMYDVSVLLSNYEVCFSVTIPTDGN